MFLFICVAPSHRANLRAWSTAIGKRGCSSTRARWLLRLQQRSHLHTSSVPGRNFSGTLPWTMRSCTIAPRYTFERRASLTPCRQEYRLQRFQMSASSAWGCSFKEGKSIHCFRTKRRRHSSGKSWSRMMSQRALWRMTK